VPGVEDPRVLVDLQPAHLVLDLRPALLGDEIGRLPAGHPVPGTPPPLAGGAAALDLLDEAVLGELAQVVAGRAAALADRAAELARGRWAVQPQLAEQAIAQRVREGPQRPHVGDLDGGFERRLVDGHD
jgi:hypothetical protein